MLQAIRDDQSSMTSLSSSHRVHTPLLGIICFLWHMNRLMNTHVIEMMHDTQRSIDQLRSDVKRNMNTVAANKEEDDVPDSSVFWTVTCGERIMFHLPIDTKSEMFSDLKVQSTDPLLEQVVLVSLMGTAHQSDQWYIHPNQFSFDGDTDDTNVGLQAAAFAEEIKSYFLKQCSALNHTTYKVFKSDEFQEQSKNLKNVAVQLTFPGLADVVVLMTKLSAKLMQLSW
jgi:hypothetical protein